MPPHIQQEGKCMEYLGTDLRNSEAQGPVKAQEETKGGRSFPEGSVDNDQSGLYGERRDHHRALCETNSTTFITGARPTLTEP